MTKVDSAELVELIRSLGPQIPQISGPGFPSCQVVTLLSPNTSDTRLSPLS